jgi:hypothetical protein
MIRYSLVVFLLATVLCACSPNNDLEIAEKAVDTFRSHFNAQQYAQMYAGTDTEFRSTSSEPEFVKYEKVVRDKLGEFRSAELTNFNVIYVLGKAEVRLDYTSEFAKAKTPETFTVNVKNGKALVSGYRIESSLVPSFK